MAAWANVRHLVVGCVEGLAASWESLTDIVTLPARGSSAVCRLLTEIAHGDGSFGVARRPPVWLIYSYQDVPLLMVPVLAWAGSARANRLGSAFGVDLARRLRRPKFGHPTEGPNPYRDG